MNCPDHKNRNSCLDLLLPFSDLSRQTQSVGVHQSRSRVLVGQPLQALKISEFGPRRLSPQSVTQFEFPVKVNQYMRAGWLRSFVFTIFISGKRSDHDQAFRSLEVRICLTAHLVQVKC